MSAPEFKPDRAFAQAMDAEDVLAPFRDRFAHPVDACGARKPYFCGNSLGLQPLAAREFVVQELDDWARLAVDGHFEGRSPWYPYHEQFRDVAAKLVGAQTDEVVVMNSLTVNLHLLMVSFYRPKGQRRKILIETPAFPSDIYAVKSQIRHHGGDPATDLVVVGPADGEQTLSPGRVEQAIADHRDQLALVLLGGVNYFTGQFFDIQSIVAAAHQHEILVGIDLAHAAGNVPLKLHDWNVDFAAWCNYKYLNSGPGAVAGAFVHQRHAHNLELERFAGWWGNDPKARFDMHLRPEFVPVPAADAWQLSNPPIMAMAPIRASYDLFAEAQLPRLREKSLRLTGYLEFLLDQAGTSVVEIITPRDPARRGCQLSLMVKSDDPQAVFAQLSQENIVCDVRKPNVIRAAPVPLYNSFEDVWRLARAITRS